MVTPAVIPKPHTDTAGVKFSVDTVAVDADDNFIVADTDDADIVVDADYDDCALQHPLSINIRPILKSVAGVLTDHEIDQWFVGLAKVNEGRGFHLEMLGKGELVISPMVNLQSNLAEVDTVTDLRLWCREYGGIVSGPSGIVRLPDGTRAHPDAAWLSPSRWQSWGQFAPTAPSTSARCSSPR